MYKKCQYRLIRTGKLNDRYFLLKTMIFYLMIILFKRVSSLTPDRHHQHGNYGYFVTTLPRMRECEFIKTRKCDAKMKTAPPVKYLPAGLMVRWPSTHICVAMLIISPPPPSVNKIGRKLKNLLFQSETKGSLNAF